MVLEVSPKLNVSVPDAALKSDPCAAEPSATVYRTSISPTDDPDRVTVIVATPPFSPTLYVAAPNWTVVGARYTVRSTKEATPKPTSRIGYAPPDCKSTLKTLRGV